MAPLALLEAEPTLRHPAPAGLPLTAAAPAGAAGCRFCLLHAKGQPWPTSGRCEISWNTAHCRFGTDTLRKARAEGRLIDNLIHSSDHAGAVARDLAVWFGPGATTLLTLSLDPGGSSQ